MSDQKKNALGSRKSSIAHFLQQEGPTVILTKVLDGFYQSTTQSTNFYWYKVISKFGRKNLEMPSLSPSRKHNLLADYGEAEKWSVVLISDDDLGLFVQQMARFVVVNSH